MRSILRVFLAAALGAITLRAAQEPAAPAPADQAPPVTFRVEVNYVEVDAIVTDEQGNVVSNLTAEDFEVLEDGKPQKVATFARVNIPVARVDRPLFASAPIERDVQSNQQGDGRVYLIVLDDLHTHPLRSQLVRAAARRFIEQHFGANDVAAVVHTSGRADAGQEFTGNRRLLLAAVDRFIGRKLRSTTLERLDEYGRLRDLRQLDSNNKRIDDPLDAERGYQARAALGTIRNLAQYMSGIRGRRKALLLLSEGIDYDIQDVIYNRSGSDVLDEVRDAIAAASRANVNIYAVDPRGLTALGDETMEVGSFPEDPGYGLGPGAFLNELRLAQDSLRTLAEETGGFAAVNTNDFNTAFERMVQENSHYYLLGYYPANERRDGRFRRIDVRVTRPGLRVRSRKGYAAPRGRAAETKAPAGWSEALRDAVSSPLAMTGIPMRVTAAAYKGTAPNATLALAMELDASGFAFTEKDGTFTNALEVSVTAADGAGKAIPGERQEIGLALKPDTFARVKSNGFRVISGIEMPPGRYHLRVAVAESGGKAGSVLYDVEVPDFWKAPFSMSGITLTAASAGLTPSARPKEPLKGLLPGPPTARREFSRNDEIALFAEVYENAPGAPPHKIDLAATLRADDGRIVFQHREERASTELAAGRGGYGYSVRIPLKDVAPGGYVLHVEARSRGAKEAVAGRDVLVSVR